MKIENIHIGLVARNYKDLCKILNEEPCTGKSKQLQLKRWECYFVSERQGHKILISDIYEKPKELPQRGGNNVTPYVEIVKELIMQLLLYTGDKKVNLPKHRLLEALNMINANYREGKKHIGKLSEHTKIKKIDIYDFYNTADDMFKRNVEKSLDDLENKRAVFWSKVYMVCKHNKISEATDEQYRLIMKVQLEAMKLMNCTGLNEIFKTDKIEEFNRRVNQTLLETAEIQYIYEAYSVNLNRERLEEVCKLNKESIRKIEMELNKEVVGRLKDNAVKRHVSAVKKYDQSFGFSLEDGKSYRLNIDYADKQSILTDVLVDREHVPIF